MNKLLWKLIAIAATSSFAGCASVSVHKVDRVTGQIDDKAAEGLRFYLPRPYISVYEPFIVSSEVYLASGQMSPDSNFVLLTEVPDGLTSLVNAKLVAGQQTMGDLRIDATQVSVAPGGAPQSAPVETGKKEDAVNAPPATTPASGATGAKAPTKTEVANGVSEYKVISDNSAFAVIPQPRYFNILWLPDFDEQYVVTSKAGLGKAAVVLGLGQGWSLQSLDATVDNSAIVKPLLDFYSGALAALQKVATAKIEAPLAALSGSPQGASVASAKTYSGGTPVTLKVTKVRVVAPGLYPILKPKEAKEVCLGDLNKRILAPNPPFTNIAFNTYDVVVIEAARTTGDSALRIQQYVDSTTPNAKIPVSSLPVAQGGNAGSNGLSVAEKKLKVELSRPERTTKNKEYYVPTLTEEAGVNKLTLTKKSDGSEGKIETLPDDATIKKEVIEFLKREGVVVESDDDITIN